MSKVLKPLSFVKGGGLWTASFGRLGEAALPSYSTKIMKPGTGGYACNAKVLRGVLPRSRALLLAFYVHLVRTYWSLFCHQHITPRSGASNKARGDF